MNTGDSVTQSLTSITYKPVITVIQVTKVFEVIIFITKENSIMLGQTLNNDDKYITIQNNHILSGLVKFESHISYFTQAKCHLGLW